MRSQEAFYNKLLCGGFVYIYVDTFLIRDDTMIYQGSRLALHLMIRVNRRWQKNQWYIIDIVYLVYYYFYYYVHNADVVAMRKHDLSLYFSTVANGGKIYFRNSSMHGALLEKK